MEKDYLLNSIKEQYKSEGSKMYSNNARIISDNINNTNSNIIIKGNVNTIERGKFYFMFYNIAGKTSNMEKFNPLFVIDWFDRNNTRMLYAVSINFIPAAIRTVFFNNILNFNLKTIEKNEKLKTNEQRSLTNINFINIYKLLKSIGFEWCIRQFDMRLINDLNIISTTILKEFITMTTVQFTGVNDLKLLEIWRNKILKQEAREKKMIAELLNDYKNIEQELNTTRSTLQERNTNLQETMNIIKRNF